MAKILILRRQLATDYNINTKGCYYESLINDFTANGNDVMWLNTIQSTYYKQKSFQYKRWIESFIPQIRDFNPDIIFTFNNEIFKEIIDITNCPIVLYEADLIEFWANKDFIKKYADRYYITTATDKFISTYKQLGFKEGRIIPVHPATSVKRENKEKVNNISFIGSAFPRIGTKLRNEILSCKDANVYEMYKEYWNNGNYNYKELCEKYIPGVDINAFNYFKIFDPRKMVLLSVLDLGLKLYGVDWNNLSTELFPLISAFDKTPVYSLQHNQDIYNSSYVNLSISHPQCEGCSFPWRVYDIMASSGVLVSSYASHLDDVTKGYVNIPMYKNPYDARDLCKKMLKEKNMREDIVAASNEFIEKFGRWQTNFEKIEEYTGVKITNCGGQGHIYDVEYELKISQKRRGPNLKAFLYGLLYQTTLIPGLHDLYGEKGRRYSYKRLLKYNKELAEDLWLNFFI